MLRTETAIASVLPSGFTSEHQQPRQPVPLCLLDYPRLLAPVYQKPDNDVESEPNRCGREQSKHQRPQVRSKTLYQKRVGKNAGHEAHDFTDTFKYPANR